MIMPNFLIIGAQKSGTTTLAQHLGCHPQIYISPIKEPGFFDFENRKPNFCGPQDQPLYRHMITDLEAYQRLFKDASNEVAIGEATTWYLYSPEVPERIYHHIPQAKLIAVLRNPVDRAYSAFLHARRDGRELISNFAEAFDMEDTRISQNWEYLWRYKQMGLYSAQLSRYFGLFEKRQIRIYLYEDLTQRSDFMLSDICDFLGVDAASMPQISKRLNSSGIPKNRLLHKLLSGPNILRKVLKPLIPSQEIREKVRLKLKNQNLSKPQMSAEARAKLIDVYKTDIQKLEVLIDRDLSNWLS